MPRVVRAGLIQAGIGRNAPDSIQSLRRHMLDKHVALIEEAAGKGSEVLCLQELFTSPYFPAEQDDRWRQLAEPVPGGATVGLMQELARKHGMVMIAPVFEEEITGLFYNSAAVIDSDGSYLGKYRKNHLPHVAPGLWAKFYFRPGNLGYPVFDTAIGKIGVYICYDRHFPEGARALGLNGAEIVFIPSATAGHSRVLWDVEQRFHAIANGYFVGTINRVGTSIKPDVHFYGHSYFCNPSGEVLAQADDQEAVIVTDLDLDQLSETRAEWPFYRDRRPDMYAPLTKP